MTSADLLRALTTILSAAVGAWVAANIALNRWRVELTGKRRAELAEEVLADFYKLRSETRYIPVIHALLAAQPMDQEGVLTKAQDFLQELRAKRYRFEAVFGSEAAKPFDSLLSIEGAIFAQVREESGEEPAHTPEPGYDPIRAVDAAVAEIEATCRKAIAADDRRRLWPWSNP